MSKKFRSQGNYELNFNEEFDLYTESLKMKIGTGQFSIYYDLSSLPSSSHPPALPS
jgi:hypothetical protein